ncbi:MAG: dUTP diphosphatase [Spirochaetaceae bacterium]|jgi:dUTP pyrophosphatase|nr:dUTP diphosphatase [Spirochaetaceae bacterium]
MNEIKVFVKKLNARAIMPAYETDGAAGMDLRALLDRPREIAPFERVKLPTGLALELPRGYEAQIRPRSGLAFNRGITVLNAPGTIDCDYRGELAIILINLGEKTEIINDGDRIAQIVFAPVTRALCEECVELTRTVRGRGGFGSTGYE